jgi:hypothetical protein
VNAGWVEWCVIGFGARRVKRFGNVGFFEFWFVGRGVGSRDYVCTNNV